MNPVQALLFLFAFLSYGAAEKCKEVCVLDNLECATKGGYRSYLAVVNGIKGLIAPLDPLHIDKIDLTVGSLKYELTNITVIGLKTCVVTKLKINVTVTEYKQYIQCPKLISTFNFGGKKGQDVLGLYGKGLARIIAYDYDILNEGKYGIFVKENDHRPHFFIQNQTLQTKTEVRGKLVFEIKGKCHKDKNKETEDYLNKNSRDIEEYFLYPIIKRAMQILIDEIDVYCRTYVMGEVLPHDIKEL